MSITIPKALSGNHGKENAANIGAKWAETFEHLGGLSARSAVLDIGCGPGRMAIAIGERFGFKNPAYLGFDINRRDIEFCTKAISKDHPRFQFQHLDVFNGHYNPKGTIDPKAVRFPAADKSFDFAFATSVFTHMRTPETLAYLAEARRCLKPGGTIFATFFWLDPTERGEGRMRYDFATKVDEQADTATPENPEDVIGYRKDFLLQAFEDLGYTDIQLTPGASRGAVGRKHGQDIVVARRKRFLGLF